MSATFRGFERSTPVPLDGATNQAGRLRLQARLEARITEHRITATGITSVELGPESVTRTVDLYGPGDVAGLSPGAVVRSSPPDGAGDVDGEYCTFVELRAADLPWRYSPAATTAGGDAMRPWLALVAGIEGVELGVDPDGTLWLRPSLTAELDPARAAAWAHTHGDASEARTARLLCLRALPPGSRCLAAVVPLLHDDGTPRWSPAKAAHGLPVLHELRFTTNDAGTFEELVAALHPVAAPDGLAEVTLHANPGDVSPASAVTYGALAPHDAPARTPFADATIAARVDALLEPGPDASPGEPVPSGGDHPVLGAPRWSVPFRFDPTAAWVAEVDTDPRHRAAAGLGARIAVDWQERIVDAAAARLGQTHLAAAMLRHLTAGVALARLTTARRPTGPAALLAFHGPALTSVQVRGPHGATTALDHLCPPGRALAPALLSTAATHLLRPAGPTAKASAEPDAVGDPGRVVSEALRCPAPVPSPLEPRDRPSFDVDPERAAAVLRDLGEPTDPVDVRIAVSELPHDRERDQPWCAEPGEGWVDEVAGALDDAFRPDGVPVDRVVGRIGGLHERWDVPLEVRPDLDLPLWDWLRAHAPDWLLPRAGLIPRDGVVALRSDRSFVASLLIGASRQALRELRWRGVPLATGAMPMRTFWQHVASADNPPPMVDLVQPASWPPVALGELPGAHGSGDELVIAFRSDLVRRYPDTEVYLAPAVRIAGRPAQPDLSSPVPPSFTGRLEPDVWFFGFPVPPGRLGDHMLVLEEPDRGPRFRPPAGGQGAGYSVEVVTYDAVGNATRQVRHGLTDGGAYAAAAYAQPIRAVLDGRDLIGGGS